MNRLIAVLAGIALVIPVLARAQETRPEPSRTAQVADDPSAEEPEPAPEPDLPGPPEAEGVAPAADTAAPAQPRRRGSEIEEIVVHAGESEAAADLSAGDSVTGFDASDLEALGAQSIEDLAGFTPNLEIVTAGATTPTFFIRGVGLNDFSPNSSGAVAIYQDDVPKNAPALQLGTLFDMEGVNILRGPQGTGPARNASAGAIKLYSKKPTGDFAGFLKSEFGNYDSRDFEGAVEMPLFEDILSGRFAFRYTDRDGWMDNRCATNPRSPVPFTAVTGQFNRNLVTEGGFSTCGEKVFRAGIPDALRGGPLADGFSQVPNDLEEELNGIDNWATRGILRFQPTLDQDWLVSFNLARRDEFARVGQSLGTFERTRICDTEVDSSGAYVRGTASPSCEILAFGSSDGEQYAPVEQFRLRNQLDPCFEDNGHSEGIPVLIPGCLFGFEREISRDKTEVLIGQNLELDSLPREGDFNRTGDLTNDVWGGSLKGDIALGDTLTLSTVTGYDTYDRYNDIDLDFTPNPLFEIITDDEGYQVVEDLQLSGALPGELPVTWRVGGFALFEHLEAFNDIFLPRASHTFAVTQRDWEQELWSAAGYFSFDWDFWDDFVLDGGVRYNWEKKSIEMDTLCCGLRPEADINGMDRRAFTSLSQEDIWDAPTGTIRLTYRFREDTHAFMKYTRGWKGGHYNVTVARGSEITTGKPETIDAWEAGLNGSWFNGRFGLSSQIFFYQYQDYQIFTVVIPTAGTPEFVVLNASDAEVYGGELEMTARPLPGLFLEARLSWLESKFLDFQQEQAQTIQLGNRRITAVRELDFSGNPLLNSPEFKVSLTADQTIPLGRFGSLSLRWDGAWSDDTFYDASEGRGTPTFQDIPIMPANTIGQEAFWLHNFRVGYRTPDGGIELAAWVRNATDEEYKSFAFDASALQANRTTIYFLGDPRTYGLTLTATF